MFIYIIYIRNYLVQAQLYSFEYPNSPMVLVVLLYCYHGWCLIYIYCFYVFTEWVSRIQMNIYNEIKIRSRRSIWEGAEGLTRL